MAGTYIQSERYTIDRINSAVENFELGLIEMTELLQEICVLLYDKDIIDGYELDNLIKRVQSKH